MIQIFISKLLINNNNNGRIVGIDKHCPQNKQRMFSSIKNVLSSTVQELTLVALRMCSVAASSVCQQPYGNNCIQECSFLNLFLGDKSS